MAPIQPFTMGYVTWKHRLGGAAFDAMTGAHDYVQSQRSLAFSIPRRPGNRVNKVLIVLNPKDLYDLHFYQVTSHDCKTIASVYDIDREQLAFTFETHTGLKTAL